MQKPGNLYVCGTPLGNLDDISQRVQAHLAEVDIIAAEDTRRTGNLLNYLNIKNKMISYHEHNEKMRADELVEMLEMGKNIALVSDAGMPGISDPGEILVELAIKKGIEVIPVPGPTAFTAALVVSGMEIKQFFFAGFIPRSGKEREKFKQQLTIREQTTVFYESPYRIKDTVKELGDFSNELAERKLMVGRELTKLHEEKIYGSVQEIAARLEDRILKGEIVVVISGRKEPIIEEEGWEDLTLLGHVELLMENGLTKKEAIKEVASIRDLPKKKVYKEAIAINVNK